MIYRTASWYWCRCRERARVAKLAELEEIEVEWNQANDRMQQADALLRAVDGLRSSVYGDVLQAVLSIHRKIEEKHSHAGAAGSVEHQDLEERLATLQSKKR